MRLSKEQLGIIKDVRNLMGSGKYAPRYICHAIGKVIQVEVADGSFSVEEGSILKHELCGAIIKGINGMVTFGGFMIITCPTMQAMIDDNDDDDYEDVIQLARLAWLDRMIETQVVA
jgi:hypothetical protein